MAVRIIKLALVIFFLIITGYFALLDDTSMEIVSALVTLLEYIEYKWSFTE